MSQLAKRNLALLSIRLQHNHSLIATFIPYHSLLTTLFLSLCHIDSLHHQPASQPLPLAGEVPTPKPCISQSWGGPTPKPSIPQSYRRPESGERVNERMERRGSTPVGSVVSIEYCKSELGPGRDLTGAASSKTPLARKAKSSSVL